MILLVQQSQLVLEPTFKAPLNVSLWPWAHCPAKKHTQHFRSLSWDSLIKTSGKQNQTINIIWLMNIFMLLRLDGQWSCFGGVKCCPKRHGHEQYLTCSRLRWQKNSGNASLLRQLRVSWQGALLLSILDWFLISLYPRHFHGICLLKIPLQMKHFRSVHDV